MLLYKVTIISWAITLVVAQSDVAEDVANMLRGYQFRPSRTTTILDEHVNFHFLDRNIGGKQAIPLTGTNLHVVKRWKKTIYIIHGWLGSINKWWIGDMSEAFLRKGDYQIIQVDWSEPSRKHYPDAAANAKILGRIIAAHIKFNLRLPPSNVHLVGHSLGAQAAGFAGKHLKELKEEEQLGRITGLDPAGPLFEGTLHHEHLNAKDGEMVDCYHTDSGVAGCSTPDCTVDFYPNGGVFQPGCPTVNLAAASNISEIFWPTIFCSHVRSIHYFIESINSSNFVATRCNSYLRYIFKFCASNPIITFGQDIPSSARNVHHLSTNWTAPYALGHTRNGAVHYHAQYVLIG